MHSWICIVFKLAENESVAAWKSTYEINI